MIGNLDTMIGRVNDGLQEGFNNLLNGIMTNVTEFTAFASSGVWSGRSTPDVFKAKVGFDDMLKTYVTSEALRANKYYAMVGSAKNPGTTDQATWDNQKYDPYPDDGIPADRPVGPFFRNTYRSTTTGRVYLLVWNGHGVDNAPTNGHSAIESLWQLQAENWASMDVLFDGAWNCTAAGNAGKDQVLGINPDGSLNPACISRLPIYFNCNGASAIERCPQLAPDGSCPFGHFGGCEDGLNVDWMYG